MKLVVLLAAGSLFVGGAAPFPAPPLAGTDPITGKRVALSAYKGKPVVVNIWASWCSGCRLEAADLVLFARQHPKVPVIGVDSGDSRAAARVAYKRWKWFWPVVFDPKNRWRDAFKAPGMPTTVFLNRKHEIVGGIVGAGNLKEFNAQLRAALR